MAYRVDIMKRSLKSVTILFNRINEVGKKDGKKVGNSDVDRPILNPRRQTTHI